MKVNLQVLFLAVVIGAGVISPGITFGQNAPQLNKAVLQKMLDEMTSFYEGIRLSRAEGKLKELEIWDKLESDGKIRWDAASCRLNHDLNRNSPIFYTRSTGAPYLRVFCQSGLKRENDSDLILLYSCEIIVRPRSHDLNNETVLDWKYNIDAIMRGPSDPGLGT